MFDSIYSTVKGLATKPLILIAFAASILLQLETGVLGLNYFPTLITALISIIPAALFLVVELMDRGDSIGGYLLGALMGLGGIGCFLNLGGGNIFTVVSNVVFGLAALAIAACAFLRISLGKIVVLGWAALNLLNLVYSLVRNVVFMVTYNVELISMFEVILSIVAPMAYTVGVLLFTAKNVSFGE